MRIESLLKWLRETPRATVAQRCAEIGTSAGYLRQVAYGNKKALTNAAMIERATNGAVTRQDLRPDDYWLIWPDLPAPSREQEHA